MGEDMENVITVFNNRNQSMQFASYLKRMGIVCKTIDTPRDLSVSCGISVVFPYNKLKEAKFLISKYKFSSFAGFYLMQSNGVFKKFISILK